MGLFKFLSRKRFNAQLAEMLDGLAAEYRATCSTRLEASMVGASVYMHAMNYRLKQNDDFGRNLTAIENYVRMRVDWERSSEVSRFAKALDETDAKVVEKALLLNLPRQYFSTRQQQTWEPDYEAIDKMTPREAWLNALVAAGEEVRAYAKFLPNTPVKDGQTFYKIDLEEILSLADKMKGDAQAALRKGKKNEQSSNTAG